LRPFDDSNEAFIRTKNDNKVDDPDKHHRHFDSIGSVNSSLISQMEQDKKKIQMLQQELQIEKEYNADLSN